MAAGTCSRRPNSQAKYPRLPIHSRCAIHASDIVVRERNSRASATFLASPLRFALRTSSVQPSRLRPSTTTRSACTSAASCTASPKWRGPGRALICPFPFNLKGRKCRLMICYDGDFPEMTRAYANLGCSVLFWMNNRPSRGYSEVKDLACRNSMIMATSCCCGTDELGRVCRGGSNITDATGKLLCEIWEHEGIIVTNVLLDKVSDLRANNPWYRGQRPDLYR